jgi:hypothetical protein
MRVFAACVLALALVTPAGAVDDALAAVVLGAVPAYARVDRYTARFLRQEEVDGALRPREEVLVKFQRPGRLYMRWVAGPARGRQLLLVQGRDDNRALVYEPGVLSGRFTFVMEPDHRRALRESRYPITDVGLGPLIDRVVQNVLRAQREGVLTLVDHGYTDDRRARRVEMRIERDETRGHRLEPGRFDGHRAHLTIDVATGLIVGVTIFDWNDRMVGDYAYRQLLLDAPLTTTDFDPQNPDYGFPRWRLPL